MAGKPFDPGPLGAEEEANDKDSQEPDDEEEQVISPLALSLARGAAFDESADIEDGAEEDDDTTKKKSTKPTKEYPPSMLRGTFTGVTTYMGYSIAALLRSWQLQHADLLRGKTDEEIMSMYFTSVCWRDYMADHFRAPEAREYNDAALFVEDLRPLIEQESKVVAQEQIQQAAITATAETRSAILSRLKSLGASTEILEAIALAGEGGE